MVDDKSIVINDFFWNQHFSSDADFISQSLL